MALNPSISLGYRGVELPNQLAQLGQMAQLESAQNQNQVSQMQLAQMRRDEETLKQIQATAMQNGGPSDLSQIADAYLKSGNPKFVEFGVGLREKLDKRARFARIMSMGEPPAAAPAAAPVANALTAPMQAGALGSGTFGMAPEPVANRLAAPAAAPAGPDISLLRARRNAFLAEGDIDAARAMDADIALASKEPVYHNVAGVGLVDPRNARVVMPSVEKPPAPPTSVAEFERAQKDPAFMRFLQERAAATRAPVQPVAPTITTIEDPTKPGSFLQVDARTYQGGGAGSPGVIGGARPSATAEKTAAQRVQMGKDLGFAITQLSDITKDGGLIDQSTGSGAGRLVDIGARFAGQATPGDIAIGKIAPIADLVLKMVPRFEGPQSNADTKSYKEAAGQLADASLPTKIRKEAGKTVLRLMKERQGQFVSSDMATEGAAPAQIAPPAGFVPDQR